jgi:hypothetical protein
MSREPSALKFCLASIITSSLGLAAAALNLQWNGAPKGDAMAYSWLYVQVMLTLTWFVLWPPLSLLPSGVLPTRIDLLWQFLALLTGTLPAASVAALLSNITLPMTLAMLALQLAFAILILGILTQISRLSRAFATLLVGLLSAIALVAPIIAFLSHDFLPLLGQDWREILPGIAAARAARLATDWSAYPSHFWMTNAVYLVAGVALFLSGKRPPQPS